jgi:hypothetical protein
MNPLHDDLLAAFEVHSPERIAALLAQGLDPLAPIAGSRPVDALAEMYFRSDRFPACLRLLLDRGAVLADPALAPVLLDEPDALDEAVHANPGLLCHTTTMRCTFTPLAGASLLHVAAEYGHLRVARRLIELGADVNARAAVDVDDLDGQRPIFHVVNSNENRSEPLMRLLLDAGARTDIRLAGIAWGRGFDWETTCFDVTPISYAQLGLLPQMQRTQAHTYANIRTLLGAAGRPVPAPANVPNRYLAA